jgi:hypothetical protein
LRRKIPFEHTYFDISTDSFSQNNLFQQIYIHVFNHCHSFESTVLNFRRFSVYSAFLQYIYSGTVLRNHLEIDLNLYCYLSTSKRLSYATAEMLVRYRKGNVLVNMNNN